MKKGAAFAEIWPYLVAGAMVVYVTVLCLMIRDDIAATSALLGLV